MDSALYVVATPIGNLGDITRRGLEVLAGVDLIAAEDTRRTGQLLSLEGIETPLFAYHEHSAREASDKLVERIRDGAAIALVSDAGTPTISDPGYRLVRAVSDAGLRVVPVPGACAAIAALSAVGLPSDRFAFEGFLPNKSGARRARLLELAGADATLIFYEAPHRLVACLADMVELFGADRELAIARELTKTFETLRRGSLSEMLAWVQSDSNQSRGEIVLLLGPAPKKSNDLTIDENLGALLESMAEHMPAKQAAKLLATYSGVRAKELYNHLIARRSP
ncbi:MAG: 16S rRNA (cytidine(1402)-2'-O)-methyltransferase [Congregibacter sp.]